MDLLLDKAIEEYTKAMEQYMETMDKLLTKDDANGESKEN